MAGALNNEAVQVRLPLKPEFLLVLRSVACSVGGVTDFDFSEIMHLRVAVSEVFELATRQLTRRAWDSQLDELAISFVVRPDRLEILIKPPAGHRGDFHDWKDEESRALLDSLMDTVELESDKAVTRMVKFRPARR